MKNYIIIIMLCLCSLFLAADPPDWQPITGTEFSMILFARIAYNDSFLTNENEPVVAAFGPGGDADCRAIAGWQDYDPDGFWYYNIVGNINGETITFKFYDADIDSVLECLQSYEFQNNANIGTPSEPELLSVDTSMISGNVSLCTITPPAGNIQDVVISNGYYSVQPSIYGHYQLPSEPGSYIVTATLTGYNPETIADVVVLQGQATENIDFNLIDWETLSGTQYNMVVMAQVLITGEPLTGNGYNHVAAFGPDDDCRGVAVWQEPNPPYWEGYWFFTIVSNTEADTISFQVYDSSSQSVYDCLETIVFENDATLGSPSDPLMINADLNVTQYIDLGSAWNWISFNVHPPDTAIESVFGSLEPYVYQVKNQAQSVIYYESIDTWLGDLTQISDGESYLIYMSEAYNDFSLEGVPVATDTPISLTADWNWIAYYPQLINDLDTALSSVVPEVIQVKTQAQSANYINPPGYWVGDLLQMEPGTGYKIDMSSPAQLIYGSRESNHQPQTPPTDDPPFWELISGTQYSMVYMANILLDSEVFTGDNGNLAAAFGEDGDSDCRSIASWQPPNPPHYDGFWYFTIIGNANDDDIFFNIYDASADEVYSTQQSILFDDNATIGSPFEPETLNFSSSAQDNNEITPAAATDMHIYPNPWNPLTSVSFTLESSQPARLSVYNLRGQKIITLIDEILAEGEHITPWNGNDDQNQPVSSGIYFFKLTLPDKILTQKTLLLK
ncbi:MAG: T9SS type A sorting domain-containing protein [Candidatus Cloacimonetes bacterium]|nr:T9SS type A sorting domain-containing protein [Candidatus Cloacimonadota bacterium]